MWYTGSAAVTLLVVAFVFLGQSAATQDLTSKWTTYISCMHKDFVRQVEYILANLHVAIPPCFPFPRVYCLWLHIGNTHREDRADSVHIHTHTHTHTHIYIYMTERHRQTDRNINMWIYLYDIYMILLNSNQKIYLLVVRFWPIINSSSSLTIKFRPRSFY